MPSMLKAVNASPTTAIIDSQSLKSPEKAGRVSIPMAMTQARRSKAKTAYSRRYARFAHSMRSCIGPTFKTAMAASCSSRSCSACIDSWQSSLLMAVIGEHGEHSSARGSRILTSPLKSSGVAITPNLWWRFPIVGSSNEPWLGSGAVAGWPKIGRTSTARR
jgi:hypothetical protein